MMLVVVPSHKYSKTKVVQNKHTKKYGQKNKNYDFYV